MRKLFFLLFFILVFKGFGQNQSCGIGNPQLGTNTAVNLPPNAVPVRTTLVYTVTTSFVSTNNRLLEITFDPGFVPNINVNVPFTRNGNVVTFDLTGNNNSSTSTFRFLGVIDCAICSDTNFTVSVRQIENGTVTCTSSVTNAVWNENLSWIRQTLNSNTNANTLRGSTVRYRIQMGNNNLCYQVGRNLDIINQIPQGAIFQQAFYRPNNSRTPVNLPTRNLGNQEVAIEINPAIITVFFIDIHYPCDFPDSTATNKLRFLDQTRNTLSFYKTARRQ